MNLKRIQRDGIILILFCVALYAASWVLGKNSPRKKTSLDELQHVSAERVRADQFFEARQWKKAAESFQTLIDEDPYNGYAWYHLGFSHLNMQYNLQKRIAKGESDPTLEESRLQSLRKKQAHHEMQAVEAFEKASEFLRYRGHSLYRLAILYADRHDFQTSLKMIETFVVEGNYSYRGIEYVPQLGVGFPQEGLPPSSSSDKMRLHQFRRFWELVEMERKIRVDHGMLPPFVH